LKIPLEKFYQFVPQPQMERNQAVKLVHHLYCIPLTRQDRCPRECKACREILILLFDVGEVGNPLTRLQWRLTRYVQGELSVWANTAPKKGPGRLDELGLPETRNPFELLAKELSEIT